MTPLDGEDEDFGTLHSLPADPPDDAVTADGVKVNYNADGTAEVVFADDGTDIPGHTVNADADNLAHKLNQNQRARLAQRVIEYVQADRESRREWSDVIRRAMTLLGLKFQDEDDSPFEGASTVTHPLVAEACVQFASRAIAEIFPPTGPAQVLAPGNAVSDDTEKRRGRVEDYLNYYLTEEDKGYFSNTDRLLFILSAHGSIFRKVFKDPVTRKPRARYVTANDFIVPYFAEDLETAPRYTHEFKMEINAVKTAMANGFWRWVDLGSPMQPTEDSLSPEDQIESRTASYAPEDNIRTIYECHLNDYCEDDNTNPQAHHEPAPPYIVTVDKDTQEVLGVYRNWEPEDKAKKRLQSFVHFKFLEGFGFYGLGFLHLIGTLGAAAGGSLRALLDAAARANLQGGFKSKGTGAAGSMQITPGEYKDVDMPAEELSKAFFNVPFKEPSQALFECLNLLVEAGQRFATTTEVNVGDAHNTGPVGTTVALIEQASKVFSAVHKRVHAAMAQELQLIYNLLGDMTEETYPYRVRGESRQVMREDFADDLAVLPVSDPNIFSSTQRLAIAQAGLQLVDGAPQLYGDRGLRIAHKEMLKALKIRDPDKWLPDRPFYRLDPVSENQMLLTGKPVGAFQEQNHQAHVTMHMQLVQMVMTLPPQQQQQLLPPILAHISEHVGYQYRTQYEQALKATLPQFQLADPSDLDAQVEQQVSMAVANMAPQLNQPLMQMMQMLSQMAGGPGQQQQQAQHQQELQQMQQRHQQELQQRDQKHQQDMQSRDQKHQQDIAHRQAKAETEAQVQQVQAAVQVQVKQMLAEADARSKAALTEAQAHMNAQAALIEQHLKTFAAVAEELRKKMAFEAEEDRREDAADAEQKRKDAEAAAQRKRDAAKPKPGSNDG